MAVSVAQYVEFANYFLTTTPRSTPATVNWSAGDHIVIVGYAENNLGTLGNPTNANLTSAAPKASVSAGGGADAGIYVWDYVAASSQTSQAIQGTATGGIQWALAVWVITGSPTGFANAIANQTESSISRTVSASSIGIHAVCDFNATNPPAKTPLTGSGTATERRDAGNTTNYAQWAADWVGMSAGTFSFGPNNYTSLMVAQCFIEITGPADVVGGGLAPPLAPGHPTQSFQFSRWFGVDPVASVDFTVSANVSVGAVAVSGGATAAPSAGTTTIVGVATRSTVTPEPSAVTVGKVGVATRSTVTPEPSAAATALVGVVVEGIPASVNDVTVDCSVKVGVVTGSTVTPQPSAVTSVAVGVATRSTVTPEPSAVTVGKVGVAARAGATVDISASSQVSVGVVTQGIPASVNDVTVTANVSVGVATRSTVTPAPSATATTVIGVQARSTGVTITVTAGSVSRVGILAASSPTVVWASTSKLFVGVVVSTSLTPIAIILVDRIDIWTEPAAPVYTEPSLGWIEPAADSFTEPSTGWVEPPPVEGVSV